MRRVITFATTLLVSIGLVSATTSLQAENWKPGKVKTKKQSTKLDDDKLKAGQDIKGKQTKQQLQVDPNKVKLNKERKVIKRQGPGPVA